MDIYSYLRMDHLKIAALMDQVVSINDPLERARLCPPLFQRIRSELLMHLTSEERTFYKAVDEAAPTETIGDEIDKAQDDHDLLRDYLEKLDRISSSSNAWMETFLKFQAVFAGYVQTQEDHMWENARVFLSEVEARSLAHDMDDLKKHMREQPYVPDALYDMSVPSFAAGA